MRIEFRDEPLAQLASSALVAFAFEGSPASNGTVGRLPADTQGLLPEMQLGRGADRKGF